MKYAAFISYKHGACSSFSASLANALAKYGLAFWQRRRRVFRDEDYISAGDDLPEIIKDSLKGSGCLILLASPEAAQSPWVRKELDEWCNKLGRGERIIIVHLSGTIAKQDDDSIDWEKTDALPAELKSHLPPNPVYVDMRWALVRETLNLAFQDFRRDVNRIVAAIIGRPPAELGLEAFRTYQRSRRIIWAASITGVLLSVAAGFSLVSAYLNAERAGIADKFEDYITAPNVKSATQLSAIRQQCREIAAQEDLPLRPPVGAGPEMIEQLERSCEPLWNLAADRGGVKGLSDQELIDPHMSIQWIYNDGGARSSYLYARILKGERPYEAMVWYVQSHNLNHKELHARRPQCALYKLGRRKAEMAFCERSDQKP